ncbi:MAG: undecaprenyl-diphosphate phosphatase [Phycisphaera sp.]|nr:undecaprenyl-diphosphate phosphatase [Phycisphaera sp.]
MNLWQAVVMGVVEGLTEYLPVSSTGHLILAQRAMGIANSDAANAYAVVIQGGAIVAVAVLYFQRLKQMAAGVLGQSAQGRKLAINLFVALLPLLVIVFLEKAIKHHLFGLWPVTAAWVVGGVAILAVSWWRRGKPSREGKGLDQLTPMLALVIGLSQCIAVWPGTSRSLVTIVAGVLVGLSLPAAVEFSFILGMVTLLGATGKDALEYRHVMLEAYGPLPIAVGFVLAFISAIIAVKWMVGYLNKHGLSLFGYYRVAVGVVVGVLLLMNVLEN